MKTTYMNIFLMVYPSSCGLGAAQRIVTQRACAVCEGSGLVSMSRSGAKLEQPRKCYACGGFLPWENWGRFWQSNMDVGNGGVLQRPASDYGELNEVLYSTRGLGLKRFYFLVQSATFLL